MSKSQGLGDDVEKLLKKFKIQQLVVKTKGGCSGCEKRKRILNELVPYGDGTQKSKDIGS